MNISAPLLPFTVYNGDLIIQKYLFTTVFWSSHWKITLQLDHLEVLKFWKQLCEVIANCKLLEFLSQKAVQTLEWIM